MTNAGPLPTEKQARADCQKAADKLAPQDGPPVHPVLAKQNRLDLRDPGPHQVGEISFDEAADQPGHEDGAEGVGKQPERMVTEKGVDDGQETKGLVDDPAKDADHQSGDQTDDDPGPDIFEKWGREWFSEDILGR